MAGQFKILGNKIDAFSSYEALYQHLVTALKQENGKGYITVNNVHTMMEGYWDANYQNIINEGYLSIPDGKPLQIVGKLKGYKEVSRLFGPTVMEIFIDRGRQDNLSHFFFGSTEQNLQRLYAAIQEKYPGAKVAGMLAPPFKPVSEWDNQSFISAINEARPDFIWIGLGAPKQERWMHQYCSSITSGFTFGIGAGFDYLAGNTRHAPKWMKDVSLEWLYRLVQEPGRLWKRYLTTIPPFLFLASLELAGISFRKKSDKKKKF